jgi:uncharacterized protein
MLAAPSVAAAHISLHPNTLPASSNPTLRVRVPNEETSANAVKVDMQVPPGFLDVTTELPPGWKASVVKQKLAKPIQTDQGQVTEQVSEIIWTAPKSGGIPPGSFQEFPILTAIPSADAGQTLTFKVIQTYSNGDIVRWIEAPNSSGHPAPTVNITPAGGQLQDISGTEAGPPPQTSSKGSSTKPTASPSKGASKGLGIAALIVGALGLLAAMAALAGPRRRTAG